MRKKKKKFSGQKASEAARRTAELKEYGRILSLRPGQVHESKKTYNRSKEKEITRNIAPDDFFFFIVLFLSF